MQVVIIGGGELGRMLTEQLDTDYNEVTLLDENSFVVERAVAQQLSASHVADIRNISPLGELNLDFTTIVVVATDRDSANLLISQLVKSRFDSKRIIVRINGPTNHRAFENLDGETVCTPQILTHALADVVKKPA